MKTAILQVADTGPLDSLVEMLSSVGYRSYLCGANLRSSLKATGCDTVLANADLVANEGYDPPATELGEATPDDMYSADLYVDIKAHRNYPKVVAEWPCLKGKVLWYRINGGKPEHVVNSRGDMGDEVRPGCPILTPNRWYHPDSPFWDCQAQAYACWPPFVGMEDYTYPRPYTEGLDKNAYARRDKYRPPICLVHNFEGWGYSALSGLIREFGIRVHGLRSLDGLLSHKEVKVQLSDALAYVHFKSSDAPGYSLYEALASACPVVCTRRLIWKNRMEDLLVPGETCLVFDRPTHDPICPEEVAEIREELGTHLKRLTDPKENRFFGEAGRARLKELMWSKDRPEDVASLSSFSFQEFRRVAGKTGL